jgi:hypothetical protein
MLWIYFPPQIAYSKILRHLDYRLLRSEKGKENNLPQIVDSS